jgi:hypothetical protein
MMSIHGDIDMFPCAGQCRMELAGVDNPNHPLVRFVLLPLDREAVYATCNQGNRIALVRVLRITFVVKRTAGD